MNTVDDKTNTAKASRRLWKDYEPLEKMTLVMAVFSVIYSSITAGLLWIAVGQLNGGKKDQRPWIKVISQVQLPEKGNSLPISVFLITTGKTPAKSISGRFFVDKVKNGEAPQLLGINQSGGMTTGILFPDGAPQLSPMFYELLSSDLEDYKEGRTFLVVYGHVDYTDTFHTKHWIDFCAFANGKPGVFSAEKCTAYNNTDDD